MKKHSLAEFFKSKSFYALLCVGALAIVAITMVSMNRASENEGNKNLVDLNEPIVSDVAEGGDILDPVINTPDINNPTSSTAANNEDSTSQTEVAKTTPDNLGEINEPITDGSFLEFDIVDDPNAVASNEQTGESAEADTAEVGNSSEETAATEPVEEVQEVMKPETLHFEAEAGLLWPVTGNVLMNYSIDKVIYHQTLEQFKINPAVLIDAEVGSEVLSAAKGIIATVEHNDETGLTVTAAIGNGYSLVYGQLQDVAVKVGDTVDEGQVLGTIAKPTKFYSLEGSNLYFQVLKDEKTMNPMLLLR